jgi:ribosomal protein S18 acetylase RimI-like enzyme
VSQVGEGEKPMPFVIRDATPADVPALARLHVETFIETHGGGPNPPTYEIRERQWRQNLASDDARQFCFVAEADGGELVGFAWVLKVN